MGVRLFEADNMLRIVGEQLSEFVRDEDFLSVYSAEGKPAISPSVLALVCVLQAMECLSDRMAAHMVVARIDWKYALRVPLGYKGFDPSVLCEFRSRLAKPSSADQIVFDRLIERARSLGLLDSRRQRTDSVSILSCAGDLSRLEMVRETLRLGLEAIARLDRTWVKEQVPKDVLEKYAERLEHGRLINEHGEKGKVATKQMLTEIGVHGQWLLAQLTQPNAPKGGMGLPEIQTLKTVWDQQFSEKTEQIGLRKKVTTPRKDMIKTPHDSEARHAKKREIGWDGYKSHSSESVPEDPEIHPRLITDVLTTESTTTDRTSLNAIQTRLEARGIKPSEHLVDAGYVSGPAIQNCRDKGIDLVGPIQMDSSAQAKVGLGLDQFAIDYEREQATCPQGHVSIHWSRKLDPNSTTRINVSFDPAVCQLCPLVKQCVTGKSYKGRILGIGPTHEITRQRRIDQKTQQFRSRYRKRAGMEATIGLQVRRYHMRRSKYVGLAKTALRNLMIGTAINLTRIASFLAGHRPVVRPDTQLRKIAKAMPA